jgi:secreted trypsin-like serine protease
MSCYSEHSRSRRRLFFCYIVATVLSSSTIIRYVRPATATDTRPGANKDNKNNSNNFLKEHSKRIVGGKDALEDRYPYFVSLQEDLNGIHKCGGSLVAPDIIMTAAHCASKVKYAQVGRYYLDSEVGNSSTTEENENVTGTISSSISDYETFEVLNMTSHPLYDSGYSFSHDVLLLKLDRISTKQYIKINQNSDIPTTSTITSTGQQDVARDNNDNNNDKQLIVMGIGSLSFSKFGSSPKVLQEASLSFIPNRVCRRSKDPDVEDNYQNLISDDMLCAFENSQDACQGKQFY